MHKAFQASDGCLDQPFPQIDGLGKAFLEDLCTVHPLADWVTLSGEVKQLYLLNYFKTLQYLKKLVYFNMP